MYKGGVGRRGGGGKKGTILGEKKSRKKKLKTFQPNPVPTNNIP